MTDEVGSIASLSSENAVPGMFGTGGSCATLYIRCNESVTSVYVVLNDQFLADMQGYGKIEYRLDQQRMKTLSADASTDNKALGLWQGSSAIPFVESLYGKALSS